MKQLKIFGWYSNYKSKKLRVKSVELALKCDLSDKDVIKVSKRIFDYIYSGSTN